MSSIVPGFRVVMLGALGLRMIWNTRKTKSAMVAAASKRMAFGIAIFEMGYARGKLLEDAAQACISSDARCCHPHDRLLDHRRLVCRIE